jgi:transforming growth factor-beta-induced protein
MQVNKIPNMNLLSPRFSALTLACLLVLALGLSACEPNSEPVGGFQSDVNALETLNESNQTSLFARAVENASDEVSSVLSGDGPVTVFAISNEAFQTVYADSLIQNESLINNVIGYHVVEGDHPTDQLSDGQELTTVSGRTLTVTKDGGDVSVNGVPLENRNSEVTNGVFHFVGSVLFPSVSSKIRYTRDLSTLSATLQQADLYQNIRGDGPFTVFAPTNSAFSSVPGFGVDSLLANTNQLSRVLQNHIVAGQELMAGELEGASPVASEQGQELDVSVTDDGGILVDGVGLSGNSFETGNGVIHTLNSNVLLSSLSAARRLQYDSQSQTLQSNLATTDLFSTLMSGGPYTVFAPSNSAFSAIENDTLLADSDLSRRVLQYNIVEQELTASELANMNGQTLTTLDGSELTVNVTDDGTVMVNGATITRPNVEARNGVIHFTDQVLLDALSATERVTLMPSFNTLQAGLMATDLASTLDDESATFTVFGPSDDAANADTLATLAAGADSSMSMRNTLNDILSRHVIDGQEVASSDIMNGQTVTTLGGGTLTFRITDDGSVQIANPMTAPALITVPDVPVQNGLIHGIDGVLFPEESDDG